MDLKIFGYQNIMLFLLQISLVGKGKDLRWHFDSGCSRHMVRERSMFLDLKLIERGAVVFGGMGKGKITDICKVGIPSIASIDNVL